MHRFRLFNDILDSHLTRESLPSFRPLHLYPSEASVIDREGQIHGTCLRAVWYRLKRVTPSNPPDARAQWIFELGLQVEDLIIRKCKEAGIWFADHVKWYNPEYMLSGEVDLIIRHPYEPETLIGVEIKSMYGYAATAEVMGTRTRPGFPKIHQLLQTVLYLDWFKEVLSGFKMVYLDRGATENRRDFNIELKEEYCPETGKVVSYPVVDGKVFDKIDVGGIYERFRLAWDYYRNDEPPPPDYKLYYSKEEMAQRIEAGLASKTDAEGFRRFPDRLKYRKASWQCSYCNWRNLCWNLAALDNEQVRDLLGEERQAAA